ncbi:hypothetical protein JCM14469_26270 [Desulfatiferula olefinivorans]
MTLRLFSFATPLDVLFRRVDSEPVSFSPFSVVSKRFARAWWTGWTEWTPWTGGGHLVGRLWGRLVKGSAVRVFP